MASNSIILIRIYGLDISGTRDTVVVMITESAMYYCCPSPPLPLGGSLARSLGARRRNKMAARVGRYAARRQSRRGRPLTGAFACALRSVDNVAGTPRVQTARRGATRCDAMRRDAT